MSAISKTVYLVGATCPAWAWYDHHPSSEETLSPGERLLLEQGKEVGRRARALFAKGTMVAGPTAERRRTQTRDLLATATDAIFEGTAQHAGFETRADILIRERLGWRLIEVKSGLEPKEEYLDDVAYTLAVFTGAGISIGAVSLMLLNRNWRLGAPDVDLFIQHECTSEVKRRSLEVMARFDGLRTTLASSTPPEAPLGFHCKGCPHFEPRCHGAGIDAHIFDLPRLSDKKFTALVSDGITRIPDIPAGFELTEQQERVRSVTASGRHWVGPDLKSQLSSISWPVYYLDFEAIQPAIPVFAGMAPFEMAPFQYSIHVCTSATAQPTHREYLADGRSDPRLPLAESLLRDLGTSGPILVYSSYEKRTINALAEVVPKLEKQLHALVARLVDLEAIIRSSYCHPAFRGQTSIKRTLPALVPELSYSGLEIRDGLSAAAAFLSVVTGKADEAMRTQIFTALKVYCGQDSLGMVRLHKSLSAIAG